MSSSSDSATTRLGSAGSPAFLCSFAKHLVDAVTVDRARIFFDRLEQPTAHRSHLALGQQDALLGVFGGELQRVVVLRSVRQFADLYCTEGHTLGEFGHNRFTAFLELCWYAYLPQISLRYVTRASPTD